MKNTLNKITALLCAVLILVGLMAVPAMAENPLNICIITSTGVDDGSFNQNCYEGILAFLETHPDCKVTDIKEADYAQLVPTVEKFVGDFDVFVLPGFNFAGIGDIVLANPDKYFLVVDSTIQDSEGNAVSTDNVYTMTFKEEESGFFAGVAAALSTVSNKVAVVNGMAFPSNVNYQYGFMSGVNYANAKYGTTAEYVELPSFAATDLFGNNVGGNYVGDFGDEATGKVVGETLIGQGVDIMFVAAGASARQLEAIYDGTFTGQDAMLGADTDSTGFIAVEGHQQLSDDALAKLADCYKLLKAGEIVPASQWTEFGPTDFPGLN